MMVGKLTVLVRLGLIHLQLQPRPVDNLIGEDGTEEDLGKGTHEEFVAGHLIDILALN